MIGYIGVENYVKAEVLNTKSLLQSIALFLNAEIKNQLLIEQLTILSRTDQLAGCDNRNAYDEDMMRFERKRLPIGIVFADLNGLKSTNDSYGHTKGDQLIIRTVELLKETYPKGHLYRIGGDEFVGFTSELSAEKVNELLEQFDSMVCQHGYHVSIGYAQSEDQIDITDLVALAEKRMYEAKRFKTS